MYRRHFDNIISQLCDGSIIFCGDNNHLTFPSFYLLYVGENLIIGPILCSNKYNRQRFIDQGNGAVLHLCSRVAYGKDIRKYFKFEGSLQRYWKVITPT